MRRRGRGSERTVLAEYEKVTQPGAVQPACLEAYADPD
jgi:hypothetical protein